MVSKERRKWDEIFVSLSPSKGKITGSVAKKEMIKSRLPNPVLAKVWRLSDVDQDGMLDSDEFALAMHLINIKLDGFDLPDELPGHLIPPSKKRVLNGRNGSAGSGSGSDGDSFWRDALGSGQQQQKQKLRKTSLDKNGENLVVDFNNVEGPVVKATGKNKKVASDLPSLPSSGSDVKDPNVKKKNQQSKSSKESKKSETNIVSDERKSSNDINDYPTLKVDEKEDLRKKLDQKSKKYQHLPVYDKEEEKRKVLERQDKMSKIFEDVDKQLEAVTDLTSTHMENKGIKMKQTNYDETTTTETESSKVDIHTIRYKSGVLNKRSSAEQIQGDNDTNNPPNDPPNKPENQNYSLPPYKRNPNDKKHSETYESLGNTFKDLTDKMQTVTRDLQGDGDDDNEIPFVDDGSDEDYRDNIRVSTNGRNTYFW